MLCEVRCKTYDISFAITGSTVRTTSNVTISRLTPPPLFLTRTPEETRQRACLPVPVAPVVPNDRPHPTDEIQPFAYTRSFASYRQRRAFDKRPSRFSL